MDSSVNDVAPRAPMTWKDAEQDSDSPPRTETETEPETEINPETEPETEAETETETETESESESGEDETESESETETGAAIGSRMYPSLRAPSSRDDAIDPSSWRNRDSLLPRARIRMDGQSDFEDSDIDDDDVADDDWTTSRFHRRVKVLDPSGAESALPRVRIRRAAADDSLDFSGSEFSGSYTEDEESELEMGSAEGDENAVADVDAELAPVDEAVAEGQLADDDSLLANLRAENERLREELKVQSRLAEERANEVVTHQHELARSQKVLESLRVKLLNQEVAKSALQSQLIAGLAKSTEGQTKSEARDGPPVREGGLLGAGKDQYNDREQDEDQELPVETQMLLLPAETTSDSEQQVQQEVVGELGQKSSERLEGAKQDRKGPKKRREGLRQLPRRENYGRRLLRKESLKALQEQEQVNDPEEALDQVRDQGGIQGQVRPQVNEQDKVKVQKGVEGQVRPQVNEQDKVKIQKGVEGQAGEEQKDEGGEHDGHGEITDLDHSRAIDAEQDQAPVQVRDLENDEDRTGPKETSEDRTAPKGTSEDQRMERVTEKQGIQKQKKGKVHGRMHGQGIVRNDTDKGPVKEEIQESQTDQMRATVDQVKVEQEQFVDLLRKELTKLDRQLDDLEVEGIIGPLKSKKFRGQRRDLVLTVYRAEKALKSMAAQISGEGSKRARRRHRLVEEDFDDFMESSRSAKAMVAFVKDVEGLQREAMAAKEAQELLEAKCLELEEASRKEAEARARVDSVEGSDPGWGKVRAQVRAMELANERARLAALERLVKEKTRKATSALARLLPEEDKGLTKFLRGETSCDPDQGVGRSQKVAKILSVLRVQLENVQARAKVLVGGVEDIVSNVKEEE